MICFSSFGSINLFFSPGDPPPPPPPPDFTNFFGGHMILRVDPVFCVWSLGLVSSLSHKQSSR